MVNLRFKYKFVQLRNLYSICYTLLLANSVWPWKSLKFRGLTLFYFFLYHSLYSTLTVFLYCFPGILFYRVQSTGLKQVIWALRASFSSNVNWGNIHLAVLWWELQTIHINHLAMCPASVRHITLNSCCYSIAPCSPSLNAIPDFQMNQCVLLLCCHINQNLFWPCAWIVSSACLLLAPITSKSVVNIKKENM